MTLRVLVVLDADTATTLNIYTHALPATDQHAAAYLENLLAARPGPSV